MKKFLSIVPRWFPALIVMLVIFLFSSQPGDNLPTFYSWDYFVKKASHMAGYGLLALSYFHFLKYEKNRYWLAWILAILYAATDEFHQSFVPGRHASAFDVFVFDGFGAMLVLWLYSRFENRQNRKAQLQ